MNPISENERETIKLMAENMWIMLQSIKREVGKDRVSPDYLHEKAQSIQSHLDSIVKHIPS